MIISMILIAGLIIPVAAGDPSGADTYESDPSTAVNFAWVLICGFLVMLMQAGFGLLEAGLTRAKNAANIMMKNMVDFCIGALGYWAVGFALMMGTATGITGLIVGLDGFFLIGDAYDVSTIELWFWQMVFCATAATIVSGAMAERTKFSTYCIASLVVTAFIYPLYGHWMWGGGWLSQLGALDFAGSGVVHAVGGFIALAGAWLVGPRVGKFKKDGTPVGIPGHSITLAILGVFILWFGWFGFNPGSTLAATDLRISVIAANTVLAAAAGGLMAMLLTWKKYGKADVPMTGNGIVAGLVAITAPCAWVSPPAAVLIGLVAGALVILSVWFIEWKLKIDDPVGAISVHGTNGIWGILALGLLADGTYGGVTGLLYGDAGFMVAQIISAVTVFVWAFGMGAIMFYILKKTIGIRVTDREQIEGLDIGEHGMTAYPDFLQAEPLIKEG
ncbi:ammonium transporter [Methanolacinia petrolearia DSM 11571]|uniref:Ammonium transporter n=1 Tax=Methanolacinia petrolearia (strain DSM 11571 / OCM 486 / SEBR 4847) TaxID=679926 RepID=E1RF47_METP4|nr:ammonium transporter [Methanolacinia petrolearia]ADN37291.1 ammonium transporter [Methanolacinia petrolearia DSM 11571]